MIILDIPGFGELNIKNLVLDMNGTIAVDGKINREIKKLIETLSRKLNIYIVTADTFGKAKEECRDIKAETIFVDRENGADFKDEFVKKLGACETAAIGNGMNDSKMLKASALGIAVIMNEGCCTKALLEADIVVKSIKDALELFLYPNRIKATLRK
ncbi:hypothetical protein H0A61_02825 [Koleobacter methoxysyntrophicus]|uniref:ATPase P n=1 Tax=Koleobacter methoxysyntrophicus TaxID=2751313 RepID=A0A8A0RSE1_9FIRM|nr:hypothetical protein [Koleobacter methoxysyntrophicus]QSQ10418.1 hypothetical protein H0A61_02825 [Koleobacter methoxysyntrophicus]